MRIVRIIRMTSALSNIYMPKLNITIPDEIYERLERWRDRVNISRICAEAINRELNKLEQLPDDLAAMKTTLSRLGREKEKLERISFRAGVYDGLEWARQAEYAELKFWSHQVTLSKTWNLVLEGPAAEPAAAHAQDVRWDRMPYAEGWLAGVKQFWERLQKHL
jgi:hypothetical protein